MESDRQDSVAGMVASRIADSFEEGQVDHEIETDRLDWDARREETQKAWILLIEE